jgi:hypothetical protein
MFDDADPSTPRPRPTLSRDLSAIYPTPFDVPATIDRGILNDARAHLARHVRRRRVMRWSIGLGGAAAAAAVLLAVFVNRADRATRQLASVQGAPPAAARVLPGDINGDGRVDVLDALVLSHRLQSNESTPLAQDVNHDGTVDARDVDAIALAAVRLPQEDLR